MRGPVGVSDRGHSATSLLKPGEVDWDFLFGEMGVSCLHTDGIFAALSPSTAAVAEEGMRAARRHGTRGSYDLNYRPGLWQESGGPRAAAELNDRLLPLVDVVIGLPAPSSISPGAEPDSAQLECALAELVERYPEIGCVAVTRRTVQSASRNEWSALAWSHPSGVVESKRRADLEILDRVGGGDGFAAGFLYGLLGGLDLGRALDYGTAHGALVMTTPGDRSSACLADVRELAEVKFNGLRR